jgi:hypothetical protein
VSDPIWPNQDPASCHRVRSNKGWKGESWQVVHSVRPCWFIPHPNPTWKRNTAIPPWIQRPELLDGLMFKRMKRTGMRRVSPNFSDMNTFFHLPCYVIYNIVLDSRSDDSGPEQDHEW